MTDPALTYPTHDITGVVLAGGEGRRMGGVDKGLESVDGEPMAVHAARALAGHCRAVVINANRNLERYRQLGYEVVPDTVGEFFGPLAGMASAMRWIGSGYVLFTPCDSPLVSARLGPMLWQGLANSGADIAVASDGERYHPVFALMHVRLADSALEYLQAGERKIDRWFDRHDWTEVDCTAIADSFLNINRPADRDALEAILAARGPDPSSTNPQPSTNPPPSKKR